MLYIHLGIQIKQLRSLIPLQTARSTFKKNPGGAHSIL